MISLRHIWLVLALLAVTANGGAHATTWSYHASDFLHGLLASHSYSPNSVEGEPVLNRTGQDVHSYFNVTDERRRTELINSTFKDWLILSLISDKDTDYFGVIYVNHVRKQLVLAHRGTAITWRRMLSSSSLAEDIDGVLGCKLTPFHSSFKGATRRAVDLVRGNGTCKAPYEGYSLSFAGHSLGGWIADLSVYYCHKFFDYNNVKAVTFDSPGSELMIQTLENITAFSNDTSLKPVNINQLDIVAYLSMPNVINTVMRVFFILLRK